MSELNNFTVVIFCFHESVIEKLETVLERFFRRFPSTASLFLNHQKVICQRHGQAVPHAGQIVRDGFDSQLAPIVFNMYVKWLLTRRAQAYFAISLNLLNFLFDTNLINLKFENQKLNKLVILDPNNICKKHFYCSSKHNLWRFQKV